MGITYACIQAAREYSAVVFNRIPLVGGVEHAAVLAPSHWRIHARSQPRAQLTHSVVNGQQTERQPQVGHAQTDNAHTAGAEAARAASTAAFVA